jgi:hypothetical protein
VGTVVVEVEVQKWPPRKVAGTNCLVVELALLVVEALVAIGVLEAGHEVETLPE